MIHYVTDIIEKQWHTPGLIDPTLLSLMTDIISLANELNEDVTITSIARSGSNESDSNHCTHPVRAIDFRSRDWPIIHVVALLKGTNALWQYDPDRPHLHCLIEHNTGAGRHFHAQVHPNSTRTPMVSA